MQLSFPAKIESIDEISEHSIKALSRKIRNKQKLKDYRLLIEEILIKFIDSADEDVNITLDIPRGWSNSIIKIGCEGKPLTLETNDSTDIGGKIISENIGSIKQSYRSGVNYVVLESGSTSNKILIASLFSMALAVLLYFLIGTFAPEETMARMCDITYALGMVMTRIMQALSVPTIFFAIVAFFIAISRSQNTNNSVQRMISRYTCITLFAFAIGLSYDTVFYHAVYSFDFMNLIDFSVYKVGQEDFIGSSIESFITNTVSDNFVSSFLSINPLPLLIFAALVGIAAGRYYSQRGELVREVLFGMKELFIKIMNIVYLPAPVFVFFIVLSLCCEYGAIVLGFMVMQLLIAFIPMGTLYLVQMIRLKIHGIKIKEFNAKYKDVLIENLKIGSNSDAFSYNVRQFNRRTTLSLGYIKEILKMGNTISLSGNCVILTYFVFAYVIITKIDMTPGRVVLTCFIILLLSLGIPNEPGSFMLAMIVLMIYLGINVALFPALILIEVFLSKFYSFLNALVDIITVVCEDKKNRERLEKAKE